MDAMLVRGKHFVFMCDMLIVVEEITNDCHEMLPDDRKIPIDGTMKLFQLQMLENNLRSF